eukprot:CAMPEP_0171622046 /NCGR_PEP_ID=MMETSP0990-20121206/16994_1 /TAXON_ID=483369 /ORGANISM="non described non described, Strain CCMP2098" /LENGTH=37 /DNA_ID= /DNA_START= /DNA_END= /DNA_ORIENTATION=
MASSIFAVSTVSGPAWWLVAGTKVDAALGPKGAAAAR